MSDIIELEPVEGEVNMDTLIGKDLIFKYSGEIQESNIDWFVGVAETVLNRINTSLETDEDFVQAKKDAKDCKTLEVRIFNLQEKAKKSAPGLNEVLETLGKWEKKFSNTRLDLDKKVVSEWDRKKKKITDAAKANLRAKLEASPVRHAFAIDFTAIDNAVKGKRLVSAMESAVKAVEDSESTRLAGLERDYQTNMAAIAKAEAENIGLRFPDSANLALSVVETVAAIINSRILQHQIDMAAAKKKEEEDRLAAEKKKEDDRLAEEKRIHGEKVIAEVFGPVADTPEQTPMESAPRKQSTSFGWSAPSFPGKVADPPPAFPNPFAHQGSVFLRVEVEAGKEQQVMDAIGKFPSVLNVSKI